jgi:hypothetical protein
METKTRTEEERMSDTVKRLIQLGGNEWRKSETLHRVYLNTDTLADLYGLDCSFYRTGNVSSASLRGSAISNSEARRILGSLPEKFWYDIPSGTFAFRGYNRDVAQELKQIVLDKIAELDAAQVPEDKKLIPDVKTIEELEQDAESLAVRAGLSFGTYCTFGSRGSSDRGEGDCCYFVHHGDKPRTRHEAEWTSSWTGTTRDFCDERYEAIQAAIQHLKSITQTAAAAA